MKKIIILSVLVFVSLSVSAVNLSKEITSEVNIKSFKKLNPEPDKVHKRLSDIPVSKKNRKKNSPGNIPSFWWSFVLSAIGAYTIYAIGLGPVSVLIVYFASKKNKIEVRKALWGWITGTILGLGIWALIKLM